MTPSLVRTRGESDTVLTPTLDPLLRPEIASDVVTPFGGASPERGVVSRTLEGDSFRGTVPVECRPGPFPSAGEGRGRRTSGGCLVSAPSSPHDTGCPSADKGRHTGRTHVHKHTHTCAYTHVHGRRSLHGRTREVLRRTSEVITRYQEWWDTGTQVGPDHDVHTPTTTHWDRTGPPEPRPEKETGARAQSGVERQPTGERTGDE